MQHDASLPTEPSKPMKLNIHDSIYYWKHCWDFYQLCITVVYNIKLSYQQLIIMQFIAYLLEY